MARKKIPDAQRGEVYGCWMVLRDSFPLAGHRRYYARALCCMREQAISLGALVRRPEKCNHCSPRNKKPIVVATTGVAS